MSFTHFNEQGRAKMVDITNKKVTNRVAIAKSEITVSLHVLDQIEKGKIKKGDVFSVAQVAAVMAAKNTPQMIPMCHPLALTGVDIQFFTERKEKKAHIQIVGKVKTTGKTGVEMEALTAVCVAALTIYDMCKALDPHMVIGPTYVSKKQGGRQDFTK